MGEQQHFRRLGVRRGATPEEITRAYKRRAHSCHPDLHPNSPKAHQKFIELTEAYEHLKSGAGERRQERRIKLKQRVQMMHGTELLEQVTDDLSLGGIRFRADDRVHLGDILKVFLKFPVTDSDKTQICFVEGQVVWSGHGRMGLAFVDLPPESRRLIEHVIREHDRSTP